MTGRATKEWVGKTPDSKVPPRVRLRIFDRENGRCHICGQPIQAGQKWEADHVPALVNGGENRESKIFPAHETCHRQKTNADLAEKTKTDAMRQKHLGIKRSKPQIKSRNDLRTGTKRREHPVKMPPRRPLYTKENTNG